MYNHTAVINILGGLIKKPDIFLDDNYKINEQDFAERLHIIVFSAISNLFHSGSKNISPVEIDIYLSNFPIQKQVFDDNSGIIYIENVINYSKLENFEYNYNVLKKCTLLRELKSRGFSVSDYYDDKIVDPKKIEEMEKRFKDYTIEDILNGIESKMLEVKDKFYLDKEVVEIHAGDDFDKIFESYQNQPIMGLPLNSNILNTIYNGTRTGALYLNSAPTGGFKTRTSMGNTGKISVPYYYDTIKNEWIFTGFNEPSLFITTELSPEEVSTMLMAYISGVPEDNIVNNKCSEEEKARVRQANNYIKSESLHFVQLPNFTPNQIEQIIKKYYIRYGVRFVWFDYIFTSIKMLQEISSQTRGMKVQEHNVLLMFIDKLKQLTTTLDIHISTSTQVSDGWQNAKNADSSLISACKALANKADIASVTLPVKKDELELIRPYLTEQGGFYLEPNICVHVYKVRRGKYNKIKVYLYFDGGTCRTTELFATDSENQRLDISGTNIMKILEDTSTEIPNLSDEDFEQLEEITTNPETTPPWEV